MFYPQGSAYSTKDSFRCAEYFMFFLCVCVCVWRGVGKEGEGSSGANIYSSSCIIIQSVYHCVLLFMKDCVASSEHLYCLMCIHCFIIYYFRSKATLAYKVG